MLINDTREQIPWCWLWIKAERNKIKVYFIIIDAFIQSDLRDYWLATYMSLIIFYFRHNGPCKITTSKKSKKNKNKHTNCILKNIQAFAPMESRL